MKHIVLSAVVLTRNEEKNIEKCLSSLSFCDEIVVIDDGSSDNTVKIAEKKGAIVYSHALDKDFAAQRNYGLTKIHGEWILFLDADETVSDELKEEITNITSLQAKRSNPVEIATPSPPAGRSPRAPRNDEFAAYSIKRRDYWWGKEMKYGEVSNVRTTGLIRLMRKNTGTWKAPVHEVFETNGETGTLTGFINHYPHPTVADFLHEINVYSTYRAHELLSSGKSVSIGEVVGYPVGKFIYTYFIKCGFLDGAAGFAYAFLMSFHSFLVRAKLYQYLNIDRKKYD